MDNAQPAPSVLETLRTVEFRLGLKGYNVDEVDEYLEKAAVEAEGMQEQLRQANERLRQASERIAQLDAEKRVPAPAPVPVPTAADPMADETLQRTLLLAQRFVEQTKRESEAEAAELISQAEDRARATVAQAEEAARKLTAETEHRVREEVTRLEACGANWPVTSRTWPATSRPSATGLRTALAEVLKWVDDNVQPENALIGRGPRPAALGERRPGRRTVGRDGRAARPPGRPTTWRATALGRPRYVDAGGPSRRGQPASQGRFQMARRRRYRHPSYS